MTHTYKVDVESPDGREGDTVVVEAKDAEDAKELALQSNHVWKPNGWVAVGVYRRED